MIGPKVAIWRSKKYRMFVAGFPCFSCGIEGSSQAAHPNFDKGLSLKTDDSLCFPLCSVRPGHVGCHQMLDLRLDGLTRDERREMEKAYTARMQARAKEFGWFKDALAV